MPFWSFCLCIFHTIFRGFHVLMYLPTPSLCFCRPADDVPNGGYKLWEALTTPPTYSGSPLAKV